MPRADVTRGSSGASPGGPQKSARSGRKVRVLACTNCRSRKTRCDGTRPCCKTCEVYHDQCHYDNAPSASQMAAMSRKIMDYETRVQQLESELGLSKPSPVSLAVGISPTGASDGLLSNTRNGVLVHAEHHSSDHVIRDAGTVPTEPSEASHSGFLTEQNARIHLKAVATESRTWEHFALGNAALRTGLPEQVLAELLSLYWSWVAPLFMWVYRPAFMRDMATGGEYCSDFLLMVLCAHSSRFLDKDLGSSLVSRAKLLLGPEIGKPTAVATVQALLQLSARELAYGFTSQAWLYSGMAFRMVSDLGLHPGIDTGPTEEIEILRRLFWSCYFWDKSISLYLGRMPTLTELPHDREVVLLDDSAEHEPWTPYFAGGEGAAAGMEYTHVKSHAVSCFQNSCRLSIILNDILHLLYSHQRPSDLEAAVRATSSQLDRWRADTPAHLKYEVDHIPAVCGPPHVLTQNLLYHTTRILLHRPFSNRPEHRQLCRDAATSIEALVRCFEQTFGFDHMTYLMAYCVYTGASATVQDLKDGITSAARKIETYVRALQGSCKTCPGVQRSLDIIQEAANEKDQLGAAQQEQPSNFLPAFPRSQQPHTYADRIATEAYNLDPFSMLECFPEEHLDAMGINWVYPTDDFT